MRARISACCLFRPGGALGPGWRFAASAGGIDLQIHPRIFDLVIATHGRSIYVLDDARPFRELTPEIASEPAHLFKRASSERCLRAL